MAHATPDENPSARGPGDGRPYAGKSPGTRGEERRTRLLGAAVELFGTQGYAATTLQQICARARVAPRHFYEHFESREAILVAILEALSDEVVARAARCGPAPSENPLGDLQRRLAQVLAFYGEHPLLTRIACIEVVGVSDTVEQRRREKSARFRQLILDDLGALARRRKIPARDYTLTAVALIGALDELLSEWVLRPESIDFDAIVAESSRLLTVAVS